MHTAMGVIGWWRGCNIFQVMRGSIEQVLPSMLKTPGCVEELLSCWDIARGFVRNGRVRNDNVLYLGGGSDDIEKGGIEGHEISGVQIFISELLLAVNF